MASSVIDAGAAASPPPRQTSASPERQHHISQQSPLAPARKDSSAEPTEEDDLDPAAFLKSVRELSEKREREDNERYRKLEEEIEKGRQERLARRVERARSISPQKAQPETPTSALRANNDTAVNTPSSTKAALGSPPPLTPSGPATIDTAMASKEPPQRAPGEVPEFKGFGSIKRGSAPSTPGAARRTAEASDAAPKPSPSAAMPTRSNTMKWQQRPTSRGTAGRPMSMAAPAHTRDTSVEEPQLSRDQIAASLGARDPSYFRQTADRGVGNAAYRRSKEETNGGGDVFSGRRGLPGMSRESSAEPVRAGSPAAESVVSETPSRFSTRQNSNTGSASVVSETPSQFSTRQDSNTGSARPTTPSVSDYKPSNDLPFRPGSSGRMSSTTTDSNEPSGLSRTPTMSASQARLAGVGERPSSPTKGMGGFVQSALMKRSDSQNKRWSAQPTGGLSRQGSTASARSGFGGLQGSYSMPKLEPVEDDSRDSSHEPSSRPSSSSSNLTALASRPQEARPGHPSRNHSRSKSVASTYSTTGDQDGGLTSPMGSPSKRWSPNKSSWIESALSKPDSPKPSPTRSTQPSWMENIARAKAQRTSAEAGPGMDSPNPSERSRPSSPTKETPFGPALLKRPESKDFRSETGSTRSITPPTKAKPASLSSRPTSTLTQESLQISEKLATPTTKDETSNFKLEAAPSRRSAETKIEEEPAPRSSNESMPSEKPDVSETPSKQAEPESAKSPPPTKPKPETISESPELGRQPSVTSSTKSPPIGTTKPEDKPKPEPAPKPTTDFRSTLRSRPVSEPKAQEQPEFMSKFGSLRKAQTERYVAPDVLKDNITRGKRGLTITGGPQKRERKDELRDSLLAKKEQWKQEKEAGIKHERTPSGPPPTASKPEALTRRELLGRSGSVRGASPEKTRNITPEALRFQKSIREKPKVDVPPAAETPKKNSVEVDAPEPVEKKPSPPPSEAETVVVEKRVASPPPKAESPVPEKRVASPPAAAPTSKLAARFNPGLAGILARGLPSAGPSPGGSRSESPVGVPTSARSPPPSSSEPPADGAPLADVRKGRAKGPKKRRAGAAASSEPKTAEATPPKQADETVKEANVTSPSAEQPPTPPLASKPSPSSNSAARFGGAVPGPKSAASVMAASLNNRQTPGGPRDNTVGVVSKTGSFSKPAVSPKPSMTAAPVDDESPVPPMKGLSFPKRTPSDKPATPAKNDVPEFKGFGSGLRRQQAPDEDKENTNSSSPSVKDAVSSWGVKKAYKPTGSPAQIQLPTKKDEEAAMRSASLLASSPARSPSRPGSSNGLGGVGSPIGSPSPAVPPKPAKSSRIVSGQLREASPNKDSQSLEKLPETEAERLLVDSFGSWPTSIGALSIDTQAVINTSTQQRKRAKTLRKTIQKVDADGSCHQLPPQEEYTLFDESVYVCTHTHTPEGGSKASHVIVWTGQSSTAANAEAGNNVAKAEAKREGSQTQIRMNPQGHEQAELFEALGGILVTRRGAREGASKQFMLCGRKHLGHIAFDEVDFTPSSLCSAFAYLISYPVTLQETKLYLWKGSACSSEEIGAAKLAAMDLSETGEIIEVDQGAEFASFLKIFGLSTTKSSIPTPVPFWQHKSSAPETFTARLFSIQQSDTRGGIFSAMFRRPSWGLRSPAPEPAIKAEATEISPFTQSDLDAEGLYLLDAHGELFLLPGPLFFSLQPENVRNTLFAQALLFASDYAVLAAASQERSAVPEARVVFTGCPDGVEGLFRGWDGESGLWGSGSLMAGNAVAKGRVGEEVRVAGVGELVRAVCR